MASKNSNITMDEALWKEIEEWANSPNEMRTLSNAVAVLCRIGLDKVKEEKK